jgi:aspartate/methionine/tyrosine aminotransferase
MPEIANWMDRLGTETAFEVLARAKELEAEGKEIVHLEIGEPDFDTPENIISAAKKALDDGWTHYGPSAGLPQFREVIAEYVSKTRDVDVSPGQVIVTPGGKPMIFFTILALAEKGDEIIYPNPGYPIYESMINYLGAKAVPIPLREEKDFRFDIDELESLINEKTKLLIINSPQNPTGGVLTRDDLKKIANLAIENDLWVLSDEVYIKILYEGEFHSIYSNPGMKERTILLDGHSKTYAMTGWRLGFGVVPEILVPHITRLMTNSVSHTASFIQIAGMEALIGSQKAVDNMVSKFKERRDVIVGGLNEIPNISCKLPQGAFYVFPNITKTGYKSKELEVKLLEEAGVASLAGTSFGKYGEGYLRFSFANNIENINKALERIRNFLK